MTTLAIHLPTYHAKQIDFATSPAKRKVIVAGRRGGKTTGVARLAVESMLKGRRVLEAAPTHDQTESFWNRCKRYLHEPIKAGVIYKNETDRVLELNGGRIRAKTAWDADSLRGDYADMLIFDEYSIIDPDAWEEVGAPMLLDNDGDAIFIFTPKRKNHAFQLYQKAIADETGRWQAWHFTSHDNPYLSKEALEEIISDMTDSTYRQEILAEFLESEGAVFRNLKACMNAPISSPEVHEGHQIVAGLDLAKSQDFTAISIMCANCLEEIKRDRFNQIDYLFQVERVKSLCYQWGVNHLIVDATGVGSPVVEHLQRDMDIMIESFVFTAISKPPLIENLSLCFDKVEAQFQSDPIWTGELEAYEIKQSANAGRPVYSAPQGLNDDTVIARALVWSVVSRANLAVRAIKAVRHDIETLAQTIKPTYANHPRLKAVRR